MGRVYLNYFRNLEYSVGNRIAISSSVPMYIPKNDIGFHATEFAPEYGIRFDLRDGNITWKEFVNAYCKQAKNTTFVNSFNALVELVNDGQDVTLLCYEAKGVQCHRYILAELLIEAGIECYDIEYKGNIVPYYKGSILSLNKKLYK